MSKPYTFSSTRPELPKALDVAYIFSTAYGHVYKVAFEPVSFVTSLLDCFPTISDTIIVTLAQVEQGASPAFDGTVGITVVAIIRHYLEQVGVNRILAFQCASYDGKQAKRHHKFDRWFKTFAVSFGFEKVNTEFLEPSESGYSLTTISFLFSSKHPYRGTILLEIDYLQEEFGGAK